MIVWFIMSLHTIMVARAMSHVCTMLHDVNV